MPKDMPKANSQETPTIVNNIGWRIWFAVLSAMIVNYRVTPGRSFFTELGLFVGPLLFDLFAHRPSARRRKIINSVARGYLGAVIAIVILGLIGLLNVDYAQGSSLVFEMKRNAFSGLNGFTFPEIYFWAGSALPSIALVTADWFGRRTPAETQVMAMVAGG